MKRNPYQRHDDVPLPFEPEPRGERMTRSAKPTGKYDRLAPAAEPAKRPGPKPKDDSLRALVASGAASWLKVAVPADLHERVRVAAIRRRTTASALVAEALRAHLDAEA